MRAQQYEPVSDAVFGRIICVNTPILQATEPYQYRNAGKHEKDTRTIAQQ